MTLLTGGTVFVLSGCEPNVRDTVLAGVETATGNLASTFIAAFFQSLIEPEEVMLVDLNCDRAGLTFEQQRRCTNPLHLNVFKVGPAEYWTIGVDPDSDRGLLVDRNARGHQLHVVGNLYTRIRTLHVTSHTDKGAVGLSTDLRPASRIAARVLPDP